MYGACIYDAANFVTDILSLGGAAAAGADKGILGVGWENAKDMPVLHIKTSLFSTVYFQFST